ncbi:hypothetical protein T01_16312 [Trichinella spiralis]|uniref:Uncharacterized protein n=1 Tax=Trichinella spiralis TaxID=6334 RepID=A0A0V1ALM2_TRISP|nr:hypothetical protein T01_15437 [Trichinella spiralis]KRY25796.1 hypothetical protein T01_16312 [Trichinella spiralis]
MAAIIDERKEMKNSAGEQLLSIENLHIEILPSETALGNGPQ